MKSLEHITPLLTQLAEKLNTTIEHLWSVMTTGIVHEAFGTAITLAGFGIVITIANLIATRLWKKHKHRLINNPPPHGDPTVQSVLCFIIWVLSSIYVVIFTGNIYAIYLKLSVPEYMALQRILSLI